MARNKPVRNAVEYAAARVLAGGLSVLPLAVAAWCGRRLGDCLRLVDRRHRTRVYAQASERLGIGGEKLDQFVRDNFRNYGLILAEFAHLARMDAEDVKRSVDLSAFGELLDRLKQEGKGVLFITAHFGNWEWANSIAKPLGMQGGSIARPLDNPLLNEYVRGIRERNGLRILDKQGAIRKALRELRANNFVGILIDQDAGPKGLMSPFFGKPASTITIPIELAIRTGAPIVTAILKRNGGKKPGDYGLGTTENTGEATGKDGRRFTMLFNPRPHRANPDAPEKEEVRRLTNAVNADLERLIMQAPEQWFWIHRRWKSAGEA